MFNVRLAVVLFTCGGSLCSRCRPKRLHDDGPEDSDSQDKRRHVDGSGISGRFSPGRSDSDPLDTSSREECNERGLSNLSQLDALIAAAQAELVEDCVAHPLSPDPPYSQQSLIHPGSSSSMVGNMVTATISTLSTAVNNSSQGGLDARISMGWSGLHLTDASGLDGRTCETSEPASPLHLWIGDDVAGHACEELMFIDPLEFNLWMAQDLANRPVEILESDFDLGDGQTS
jgi:hypothetical protein